jgi:mRNA interferase MazF
MKGKIVAIPFPFTDLKGAKVRPALVIYEGHEDVIVAFISSKIPG